jgi:hypothetical protein
MSIANSLDKIRNTRYKFAESIRLGESPEERDAAGCLKCYAHNPARESKREEHFLTSIGRNPLKSPDSEK